MDLYDSLVYTKAVYIGFDRLKEVNKELYDKYSSIPLDRANAEDMGCTIVDYPIYFIYLAENAYEKPKDQDFNYIIERLNEAVKDRARIVIINNLRFVVRFSIGVTALELYLKLLDTIKDSINIKYEEIYIRKD